MQELNIAYVLTDRALRITEISDLVPGYVIPQPAAYLNAPLTELFQELIGYEDILQDIISGKMPRFKLERINRETAQGEVRYINFIDLPRRDHADNIVGVVHLVEDVTPLGVLMQHAIHRGNELSLLHAELNKRNEQLERANAELQHFAYVVSHDLREPLRMITSYLSLLQKRYKGKLDATADEFIWYAFDGAARLDKLIKALLTLSRVGTHGKEFVVTDSTAVLQHALVSLSLWIEGSGAVVTYDPLPIVVADELQLEQLFLSLIGNALKFQPPRTAPSTATEPPRIHISSERGRDEWVFSIRDNGIGIAPEHFARIFGVFQRLGDRTEYEGVGIGLAICKKIVERHEGRIWVESQLGAGATFYFTLPMRRGKTARTREE